MNTFPSVLEIYFLIFPNILNMSIVFKNMSKKVIKFKKLRKRLKLKLTGPSQSNEGSRTPGELSNVQ